MLDIVMYHYVRPVRQSRYPNIKALAIDGFHRQLDYFSTKRSVVSTADVINAVKGKFELPENSIWLTFDDGYRDHLEYVVPLLEQYGFDGAFFPVSDCYEKRRMLDVNKIHFILATIESDMALLDRLKMEMFAIGYHRTDWDAFWASVDKSSRYDSKEVVFFKRMTQKELPTQHRYEIITNIFADVVRRPEAELADELYMSRDELISLHSRGFTIGSHTASHRWLDSLSIEEQQSEISESLQSLEGIRGNLTDWIMCYPYGGYNNETLTILKSTECALALTTKVGSVDIYSDSQYELKRLNTNDYPQ